MRYRYRRKGASYQSTNLEPPPCPASPELQALRLQEDQLKNKIARRLRLAQCVAFASLIIVLVYLLVNSHLNWMKLISPYGLLALVPLYFCVNIFAIILISLPFSGSRKDQNALRELTPRRETLEKAETEAWQNRWRFAQDLRRKEIGRLRSLRRQEFLKLDKLDPFEFELLVAERFAEDGFQTTVTKKSGDYGIDVWIEKDERRGAIQCKRYSKENKVGRPEIQSFAGALQSESADFGIFITTGVFAENALEAVQRLHPRVPISVMAREEVFKFLRIQPVSPSFIHDAVCLECGTVVRCDAQILTSNAATFKCPNKHEVSTVIRPEEIGLTSANTAPPLCPSCGQPMRKRSNRRTREPFWGCSSYPSCKGTLPAVPKK